MIKLKTTTIKKYLKDKTKEELENEILSLAKKYPIIQEHFYTLIEPNNGVVLNKYRKIIEKEFSFKKSGEILRYPVIKKAIKDFTTITDNGEQNAEIMIYTVELGVDFTLKYGDIDQKFYHTISDIYEQGLQQIVDNQLEDKFLNRCTRLLRLSQDVGWGFSFDMMDIYSNYFGHLEEE